MIENTLMKMKQMNFYGMHRACEAAIQSGDIYQQDTQQTLATLIDNEWDERNNRKIERLIKAASFQYRASLEELRYEPERNLNKSQIQELGQCSFIERTENILVTGATGVGKSYLATAIGYQACIEGIKVKYFNCNKLLSMLKLSKLENTYLRELKKLETTKLLILDDFGLQTLDNKQDRISLLEIIEDRQSKGSIIIASQLPVSKWFDIIGDKTIADAILDRLIHQSIRIELKGESMRKKIKR